MVQVLFRKSNSNMFCWWFSFRNLLPPKGYPSRTILGPLLFLFSQIVCLTVILKCIPPWYVSYLPVNNDVRWMSFSPVWMKISKISPNGWSLTNSHLIFYQNRVYTSRLHTWAPKPNPLFWPSMVLSKTRYQSILINANLTWGNHIDKLASGTAAIKRVRQFFPQQNCISITKPWFSRISTTAMLFVCGIKLADKLPKSCCAAPNFLKLCASSLFPKSDSTQRDIEKPLLGFNKSHNGTGLNPSMALLLST